ncbi:MAG: helix-turn-helix domain-containing protein [Actinophytocola sp.]|nr:helix-turn-helix domain-containing protein [Actinophytocola sp.]
MEIDDGEANFGDILRRYRRHAGLTQEALAERTTISSDAISSLERGKRRSPRRLTAELLANALELTASQRTTFLHAATRAADASTTPKSDRKSCRCATTVEEPVTRYCSDRVQKIASSIIALRKTASVHEISMAAFLALATFQDLETV